MSIAVGDIVEVMEHGTAPRHMLGVKGRVDHIGNIGQTWYYVEDPTGGGLFQKNGDTKSWMFRQDHVKKVEEDLADWEKELLGIETKQEEPEVKQNFKVGDTVEVIEGRFDGGPAKGEKVKVIGINKYGGSPALSWSGGHDGMGSNKENNGYFPGGQKGWFCDQEDLKLVAEKPKTRSQEIELGDVQKGDLIVCFWNKDGVETRKKGIAHEKVWDGDWTTSEGEYLTYSDEADGSVEHIYLIERPEVKGLDALDKTKKYLLKGRDGATDFMLEVVGGDWKYGWVGDNTRVNARQYEKGFTEGTAAWEKPVEYKPTIQEQLDDLGVKATDLYRYEGADVMYKFYGVGRVSVFGPEAQFKREVTRDDLGSIRDGYLNKI